MRIKKTHTHNNFDWKYIFESQNKNNMWHLFIHSQNDDFEYFFLPQIFRLFSFFFCLRRLIMYHSVAFILLAPSLCLILKSIDNFNLSKNMMDALLADEHAGRKWTNPNAKYHPETRKKRTSTSDNSMIFDDHMFIVNMVRLLMNLSSFTYISFQHCARSRTRNVNHAHFVHLKSKRDMIESQCSLSLITVFKLKWIICQI